MIKNSKDKLIQEENAKLVYKIDCSNKKSYIGETKRNVKMRQWQIIMFQKNTVIGILYYVMYAWSKNFYV